MTTSAFKERAVQLSYERSSITDLALELGVLPDRIYKWRSEYSQHGSASFSGHGFERLSDEGRRVKELEKELKTTELELGKSNEAGAEAAARSRKPQPGMIFHSDQSLQYNCVILWIRMWCRACPAEVIAGIMPWQRASFKSLKYELIYGNKLLTTEQVDLEISESIEIFYNKIRRHSALKNRIIDEFNKLNKIPA